MHKSTHCEDCWWVDGWMIWWWQWLWCWWCVHIWCYKCEQYENIYCVLDLSSIVFSSFFRFYVFLLGVFVCAFIQYVRWYMIWAKERPNQWTNGGRKERYSFVICIICYVCLLECLLNLNKCVLSLCACACASWIIWPSNTWQVF